MLRELQIIKLKFLWLVTIIFLWNSPTFGQFTVYNVLNCPFKLLIENEEGGLIVQYFIDNDSLFGDWSNPTLIPFPHGGLCDNENFKITLESINTKNRTCFYYQDYFNYIQSGGYIDDFSNPSNKYIFCCGIDSDKRSPCATSNECAVIEIDQIRCILRLRKPEIPYCH